MQLSVCLFLHDVPYTVPILLRRIICITIKTFLVGDHFLYSHDLYVSFSHDAVRRNKMLGVVSRKSR